MADKYVLDACALLALVYKEIGGDLVKSTLRQAGTGGTAIYMNKLNLYEAYYDVVRSKGLQQAETVYDMVMKSPVQIIDCISDTVLRQGAQLKTRYRMSLADSILLGQAIELGASIVTSDHHEFDVVDKNESIIFTWTR
jgi:predicted nucleic acid-binding protein